MSSKGKTRKSKKALRRARRAEYNNHHILYQEKHWRQGYAKLLREHPYLRRKVPRTTLHSLIHSKIHDIPVPPGRLCKRAYEELQRRLENGELDLERDTLSKRIDFLISVWRKDCPATVAMLKWQRDIVDKFYETKSKSKKTKTTPPPIKVNLALPRSWTLLCLPCRRLLFAKNPDLTPKLSRKCCKFYNTSTEPTPETL